MITSESENPLKTDIHGGRAAKDSYMGGGIPLERAIEGRRASDKGRKTEDN